MPQLKSSHSLADRPQRDAPIAPGVLLSLIAAGIAIAVGLILPMVSPLLVAIVLGAAVATCRPPSPRLLPGLRFASKVLLRAGIVVLGLQLSLHQIADLGLPTIGLVTVVVAAGVAGSLWLGKRLGLSWTQRLLIACGFSICGAAAVAAVDGTVDADEEEVATAVALVVVFGTAMIAVVPLLVLVLGLDARTGGVWAGAAIHEVAQVVATGAIIGGGALSVAVVVKLARVLTLAPVLAWVSWRRRVELTAGTGSGGDRSSEKLPPLLPLFVVGFLAMVLLRTWVPLPAVTLELASTTQTLLLSAAMFALGCGVRFDTVLHAGPRPIILAAAATVWVAVLGLTGSVVLA